MPTPQRAGRPRYESLAPGGFEKTAAMGFAHDIQIQTGQDMNIHRKILKMLLSPVTFLDLSSTKF